MQKLIEGIHKFQNEIFSSQIELFQKLEKGQAPQVLFITCSDSRINPNLFTQTEPGDLFIMRNAGNIVPAYSENSASEMATIEFAVNVLKVKDIIICGHSHCGAMKALIQPEVLKDLPAMKRWLSHAENTYKIVNSHYQHLENEAKLMVAIEENVLIQLEQLRSHPSVADKLSRNEVRLHGWVYKFETGVVFKYEPGQGQFSPLVQGKTYPSTEHSI